VSQGPGEKNCVQVRRTVRGGQKKGRVRDEGKSSGKEEKKNGPKGRECSGEEKRKDWQTTQRGWDGQKEKRNFKNKAGRRVRGGVRFHQETRGDQKKTREKKCCRGREGEKEPQ